MDLSREWTDLDHISDFIEELRRISPEARLTYYRKLRDNEDLIFVSWVGHFFMDWFGDDLDGRHNDNAWLLMSRDIRTTMRIIRESRDATENEWVHIYRELYKRRQALFSTGLGYEFMRQLYIKINSDGRLAETGGDQVPVKVPEGSMSQTSRVVPAHGRSLPKRIIRAIGILLLIAAVGSVSIWIYLKVEQFRNRDILEQIKGGADASTTSDSDDPVHGGGSGEDGFPYGEAEVDPASDNTGSDSSEPPEILDEYRDALSVNSQLFGWLTCEGMDISLPVVKPETEDDFYLHHDITGEASDDGTLFVDAACSLYPMNRAIVIYGHNMRSGSMFGNIDYYADQDYLQAHDRIGFDTIYEKGSYRAICTLRTRLLNEDEEGFRYYRFYDYDNRQEFREFRSFVRESLIAGSADDMRYGDSFLLLSSCEYSQENGRIVLVCVRE